MGLGRGTTGIGVAQSDRPICRRQGGGASTGGCRNIPGGRKRLADRWDLNRWHDQWFGQRPRLVIL